MTTHRPNWEKELGIAAVGRNEALEIIGDSDAFYVYVLWKTYVTPIIPFYVGKGHFARLSKHEMLSEQGVNTYKSKIIQKHYKLNKEPLYSIVEFFDDEQDALALEVRLISLIGRHDLGQGPRCNRTDGGDGTLGHLAAKRGDSASARPVVADGIEYSCLQDAADVLSVTAGSISSRIRNGWDGYYYLDEGQKEPKVGLLGRYRKRVVVEGKHFESASEASRALGLDVRMISKRIGYGWEGYYYLDKGQLPRRTIWDSRSDKVAVQIDGIVYPTISHASRSIGESIAMISKRALSTNYPTYRRLDGKEEFRNGSPKNPEPVSVAGKQFTSLQAAAVEYGLTVGGVNYRCKSSNYPEWQFIDTDKQTQQEFEAAFSSIPVSVTVGGVDYTSQSEAARKNGIDINTLKKRCASASFPDWVCSTIEKSGSKDGRPGLISLEIDGKQYRSISEAYRATGLSRLTIRKRLASPDWPSFIVRNGAIDV